MARRVVLRARDIKERIVLIRALLAGKMAKDLRDDPNRVAAYERYLEIVSEASRYLPKEWKAAFGPAVPWKNVADLGNILRHVYHHAKLDRLWSIYEGDLDPLEAAIDAMIAAHPVDDAET